MRIKKLPPIAQLGLPPDFTGVAKSKPYPAGFGNPAGATRKVI
jgi:hypothetical protein